jgi:hypothetical protein
MQDGQIAPRRRARQGVKRSRTIRFDLSEREFGEVEAAAEQAGLAKGAFVAQAVDEAIDQEHLVCPGASMLFYRAALPLSRPTLLFVAGVIAATARRPGRAGGS